MLPLSDVSNITHGRWRTKEVLVVLFYCRTKFSFFSLSWKSTPYGIIALYYRVHARKNTMTQVKRFFRLIKNGQNARSMTGQLWVSHSTMRSQFDRQNPTSRIASSPLEPKLNGVLDFVRTSSWTFYVILGISVDLSPNRTQFGRSKSTDHTVWFILNYFHKLRIGMFNDRFPVIQRHWLEIIFEAEISKLFFGFLGN